MNKKVIIEKGNDGVYYAYNDDMSTDAYVGSGQTPEEAKNSFFSAVEEAARADGEDAGQAVGEAAEWEYVYDVASLLANYDVLNTSALARRLGINASLMRQYKTGDVYISEERAEKIIAGINELGKELAAVRLK